MRFKAEALRSCTLGARTSPHAAATLPLQENSYDCGLYLIAAADAVVEAFLATGALPSAQALAQCITPAAVAVRSASVAANGHVSLSSATSAPDSHKRCSRHVAHFLAASGRRGIG